MQASWQEEFTKQVGQGINRARGKKSDQWISERTEKLGNPISRTAVSEYRRGVRKTISVTDWLTLAAALGVPPVTLLFPGLPDTPSQLLEVTGPIAAFDALMWVTGERQTIPDSFDELFNLANGEPMGEVKNRKQYDRDLTHEWTPFDLHHEDEPSKEFLLLQACRQLRANYVEHRKLNFPSAPFDKDLPSGVRDGILKAYMQKIEELDRENRKLKAQIEELGGHFEEEIVTEYEENNGQH